MKKLFQAAALLVGLTLAACTPALAQQSPMIVGPHCDEPEIVAAIGEAYIKGGSVAGNEIWAKAVKDGKCRNKAVMVDEPKRVAGPYIAKLTEDRVLVLYLYSGKVGDKMIYFLYGSIERVTAG